MSLSQNIKKARLKKAISQKMLAELISTEDEKYGNTAISNWENGISNPDAEVLPLICKALNIDANYLFDYPSKYNDDYSDKVIPEEELDKRIEIFKSDGIEIKRRIGVPVTEKEFLEALDTLYKIRDQYSKEK